MDTGVDLSFIVKAVPAVASEEKPEEQTHEIIQVSVVPQAEVCFLQNYPNFTLNMSFLKFFFFTCRLWNPSELEKTPPVLQK